ncbi:hypothetical protein PHLCEN_2v4428 [Hermanssonia centrifuga]|uniref:Uncharacterized protein n=1 Tax=Hermanssonia centrifuga TaxID=98765 RepID=A0A2R6PNK4_9APHY|nr:hypothetical protein PHLCEN_2v4428 [Hermanssonia centrifuga]
MYESTVEKGIVIWEATAVEDSGKKKTKALEIIKGRARALLQYIVQKQAVVNHRPFCRL